MVIAEPSYICDAPEVERFYLFLCIANKVLERKENEAASP